MCAKDINIYLDGISVVCSHGRDILKNVPSIDMPTIFGGAEPSDGVMFVVAGGMEAGQVMPLKDGSCRLFLELFLPS
jgi:hypothetical protein